MKKTLLLLASVAMLLVGCAKEKLGPDAGSGEMVTANFTAQMQGMPQTKSVTDGEGTKANRCVMEIYYKGVLYTRDVQPIEGMKATFTPRLVSNRTYDVLFWADCGEVLADKYYTTDAEGLGLQAVEMKATAYAANDDARDAFYTTESVPVGQQVSSETFTLTRPFAQVNIITTDAAIIKNANLYPDGVKMVYTAPTKFNLLTETLSEEKELTVTGAPYEAFDATSPALTLEMDYLFTGEDKSALDIAFEASKTGESTVTSHSFTNIPVQRNYRTNIKGALLTTTGDWTATIVPGWNQPDEEVNFVEAGSVAAANEAFANGATSVKITSVGEETNLYLPQTTEEVTIDFANPDKGVTVKYGPAPTKAAGEKPAIVNIATNDVTKFTVSGINNIVWLANSQVALANALTNATNKQTVALANDITMTGEWTPATTKDGVIFDGKNHVISGMTITDCGKDYAALIGFMTGGEVKNVTVKNANIVYTSSAGSKARGAAIVGISYGGTIENCHAENVSIKGYQKMGSVVGYLAQCNTQFVVRNCSAKKIEFTNNTTDLTYQAGGIIGYTLNYNGDILVEGCSVSDITINNQYDGSEGANLPYYCGTFIGSLDNQAAKEGLKIELKNNTISGTNTPQIDQMYANTYFGWANNNECTLKSKPYFATILIDGQEWTPNYPVQIAETGAKYATLAGALTAATAGQTVQILKAGDYTVETLNTKAAVVEATVEGVVFNRTAGGWVAAQTENVKTVKNITWNVGNGSYQYFSNTNLENCTVNGILFTHMTNKFKDCTFINEEGYNFWVYGNVYTEFDNCTFTCPGKNEGAAGCGSALNCYNENAQTPTPVLVVKNCTFTAKEASNKYSAIYVKPQTAFDIRISNSTCNDKFCTGAISGSKLWNLTADREGTTVSIDGNMVYPFSMDADGNYSVKNVNGLRMAIKHWNALTSTGEKTITVVDGTYEVSDMLIQQRVRNKSLVIKAANEKQAVLKLNADTKTKIFFLIDGGNKLDAPEYIKIDGLKFQIPENPTLALNNEVWIVYSTISTSDKYARAIMGDTYNSQYYMHNVTLQNCNVEGFVGQEISVFKSTSNSQNIVVDNCTVNKVGYVYNGYFDEISLKNSIVTNTKTAINCNDPHGIITVTGCEISTYHDCCLRAGKSAVITDNTFNINYVGAEAEAAVIYFRGATGPFEAVITGNTFTKSADMKYDVFVKSNSGPWTINKGTSFVTVIDKGKGEETIRQQ